MKRRNSAHRRLIEFSQMYGTAFDTAPSVPFVSGTANVTATSRMNPKKTETTTDMIIPQAAPSDALRVSSLMCAEASNPVIVYCAIRRPVPKTYQKAMLPQPVPEKPELLIVSVKTNPNDWWCSGTTIRIATTTSTPTMCHHAENVLMRAVIGTPNRFTSAAIAITIV
jgi:hypothetical protein